MDCKKLTIMVESGMSLAEITANSTKSNTTVRYWLKKYGLKPKPKRTTAPIWEYSKKELQNIIDSSLSLKEAFFKTHSTNIYSSNAYSRFKKRLGELNVNYLKLKDKKFNKKFNPISRKIPIEFVLVRNSTYGRWHLRRRLIKEGLLKYKCCICGLGPEWQHKLLSLRLDHKNGINNDNRLSNLRFLCPNCDSQTEFYSKPLAHRKSR